jgi:hypothetical protein
MRSTALGAAGLEGASPLGAAELAEDLAALGDLPASTSTTARTRWSPSASSSGRDAVRHDAVPRRRYAALTPSAAAAGRPRPRGAAAPAEGINRDAIPW